MWGKYKKIKKKLTLCGGKKKIIQINDNTVIQDRVRKNAYGENGRQATVAIKRKTKSKREQNH